MRTLYTTVLLGAPGGGVMAVPRAAAWEARVAGYEEMIPAHPITLGGQVRLVPVLCGLSYSF